MQLKHRKESDADRREEEKNQLNVTTSIYISNECNHKMFAKTKNAKCEIEFIYNWFVNEWSPWFTMIYDCISITDERTVMCEYACVCSERMCQFL